MNIDQNTILKTSHIEVDLGDDDEMNEPIITELLSARIRNSKLSRMLVKGLTSPRD